MISTVDGCVQKQSCTDMNVIPACSQCKLVSIMWLESSEWMKFGGKAFFCFRVSGFLQEFQSVMNFLLFAPNYSV